jgi:hypothetical protein
LQQDNFEDLELPFSEEEVWTTIKELPSDKAARPDGYTGPFYKTCWPKINNGVMSALMAVKLGDFRHLRLLSSAYISLEGKKRGKRWTWFDCVALMQ